MSASIRTTSAVIKINGTHYKMDFDLMALSVAEQVYSRQYGGTANTYLILAEIMQVQTSAIMALAYGAMISAGEKITWDEFAKGLFTFDNYDAISEAVADNVAAMLGDGDEGAEGDEKNASSRGAT